MMKVKGLFFGFCGCALLAMITVNIITGNTNAPVHKKLTTSTDMRNSQYHPILSHFRSLLDQSGLTLNHSDDFSHNHSDTSRNHSNPLLSEINASGVNPTKSHHSPKQVKLNTTSERRRPDEPLLLIFTSFGAATERNMTHRNVIRNWASFKPFVQPVLFDLGTDKEHKDYAVSLGWHVMPVSKSIHDLPCLKEMYKDASAKFSAMFYGYSNGDLLYNDGLVKTLEAVTKLLPTLNRTLIIGKRTNALLNSSELFKPADIDKVAKTKGKLFRSDAEDFFFIARNDFIWDQTPNLVIARPAYDNYLVAMAWKSGISVVDATKTLTVLHQTGKDGNGSGSRAGHKKGDNSLNLKAIGPFNYRNGFTTRAQYETRLSKKARLKCGIGHIN